MKEVSANPPPLIVTLFVLYGCSVHEKQYFAEEKYIIIHVHTEKTGHVNMSRMYIVNPPSFYR